MVNSGIFTNSQGQDQVLRAYASLVDSASHIRIAVPYFNRESELLEAASRGAKVELLIGLNSATNPAALRSVFNLTNCSVRYFTDGFHAKVYLLDGIALLGSANLTNGGMVSNREAVILLDQPGDEDRIRELQSFFAEVWAQADVLTSQVLYQFRDAWDKASRLTSTAAPFAALTAVEPTTVLAGSGRKTASQHFRSEIQKQLYEEYKPAFDQVSDVLQQSGFRRSEFASVGLAVETNRFLNWVRLEYAIGDESWKTAKQLLTHDRSTLIQSFAMQWAVTDRPDIPADYFQLLHNLHSTLGSPENLMECSPDQIVSALLCIHAFKEQLRFTLGGIDALRVKFWELNSDIDRVKHTLNYLIHGGDDFGERICAVLYDPKLKLARFGRFCALELVGTLKPDEVPPINGRMAKALRFMGFNVRAT